MIFPHHELTVGIGLRLSYLDPVVLPGGAEGVIELHGPIPSAQHGLRHPGPGVGMAEDGSVLLQSGIDPGHKADGVVRLGEAGGVEHETVGGEQIFVHAVHGAFALLFVCGAGDHGPGVGLHVHPALRILLGADLSPVGGDAPDEPFPVPQDPARRFLHLGRQRFIPVRVACPAQPSGQGREPVQSPQVEEAHHGALPAAQVQTVVPVGAKPLADAVFSHLPGGKIQDAREMLIDRALAPVRVGHGFIHEAQIAGLLHVLDHGGDEP